MLSDKELAEFKRGPLQMLVLFLLKQEDMYGYRIAQELRHRSSGNFQVSESVLYIVLYRLEQKGLISKKKEEGVRKPKTFYHLESSGNAFLLDLLDAYMTLSQGIQQIISSDNGG